jgi:hypothetical protein
VKFKFQIPNSKISMEAGRQGGMEAWRHGGMEAGRQGSGEGGRTGSREAYRHRNIVSILPVGHTYVEHRRCVMNIAPDANPGIKKAKFYFKVPKVRQEKCSG